MYYSYNNAPAPKPSGASHASIYPYGPFETADGSVMLGIQNEREWANFCSKVLDNESLVKNPCFLTNSMRSQNRVELKQVICDVFADLSTSQAIEKLDSASIANASVNDMHGLWNYPQLRARDRWTEVATHVGRVPALRPPGTGDGIQARMDAIPAVGEHNNSILAELGL